MNIRLRTSLFALAAGSALLGATAAFAADPTQNCEDPRVDRTACYREKAAAQNATRQGQLQSGGNFEQNALARCQRQPAGDARTACEKRVTGSGHSQVRGSVAGGGKIRSTEMPVQPAPASK